MTVGVVVKVWDGIVLAADSATTLGLPGGASHVYNTANKVFHLHRRLPIAGMTWGLGNIGGASIATLAKDFRGRLMGKDEGRPDWELDPAAYTVKAVAERFVEHMYDELFSPVFASGPAPAPLGFLIAGYSSGARSSEAWMVQLVDPAQRPVVEAVFGPDDGGWRAFAQPEAMERLWLGLDGGTVAALQGGLTPAEFAKVLALLQASRSRAPAHPAMPLQDAVGLAQFMVEVTSGYTHFLLGPDTVGGPTEVASMSRHEGFKWIARKHYYDARLNPKEPDHADG